MNTSGLIKLQNKEYVIIKDRVLIYLQGNPEVIQKPYRADPTAPPPGILTGNFYKYVIPIFLGTDR